MNNDREEITGRSGEMFGFASVYVAQVVFILLVLWGLNTFLYVVTETDRTVILLWGDPIKEETKPGLYTKLPWPWQEAVPLTKRFVMWDADPRGIITGDKKTLLVDNFVLVRITDGIKFYQRMRTMPNALTRVDAVAFDMIRSELGKHDLEKIINQDRTQIMEEITKQTNQGIQAFGLETPLVRITRADLPVANKASVHQRMNAERKRISDGYRAEGQEQNTNKVAQTDREVTTLIAEGERRAQGLMGEGDAEATRIYNAAYGKDPKFFELYRSLETAKQSVTGGGKIQIFESGKEPHLRKLFDQQK